MWAPAPRKAPSHISHGIAPSHVSHGIAPRCPAVSASGCSLCTGVLCGAAKVLIDAAPDGELWWARRSAAANPHMPKGITFCYYWQRPRLKLCSENKSEAFVSIAEFGKWTLSTAHAVLLMVRSLCVIAADWWLWAQVAKLHATDSPASQTLQMPIFSQHLPACSVQHKHTRPEPIARWNIQMLCSFHSWTIMSISLLFMF